MIAMESTDIGTDQPAVFEILQDIKQRDRIGTSGQTYDNDATVKQPFAL